MEIEDMSNIREGNVGLNDTSTSEDALNPKVPEPSPTCVRLIAAVQEIATTTSIQDDVKGSNTCVDNAAASVVNEHSINQTPGKEVVAVVSREESPAPLSAAANESLHRTDSMEAHTDVKTESDITSSCRRSSRIRNDLKVLKFSPEQYYLEDSIKREASPLKKKIKGDDEMNPAQRYKATYPIGTRVRKVRNASSFFLESFYVEVTD
jgi:hypothetical protein